MTVILFHDQSPRKYGTGPGSNLRPLDLQSDTHVVLVQPRKIGPFITERLLMGRKESNQTNNHHLDKPSNKDTD